MYHLLHPHVPPKATRWVDVILLSLSLVFRMVPPKVLPDRCVVLAKSVSTCPLCWIIAAYPTPETMVPYGWQGSESFEGSTKDQRADQ